MNDSDRPATMIEVIERRASEGGVAYTFDGEPRTFADLWADITSLAGSLVQRGVGPGDRVVMALRNGHEFFVGFYAAQAAGGAAVPIFPGVRPERVFEVAGLCGARHVVIEAHTTATQMTRWQRAAEGVELLTTAERSSASLPLIGPDDVAFIQYTSGSTGDPKGVVLSHRNLLTNIGQMVSGMQITPDDRFVSWLPLYHDMGLILMSMTPFVVGASLVLLPTSLRDTAAWLDAIERHGGTFTASPDFGYRVALRQAATDGTSYDLSSLRVALNAAEPVRADTIAAFHEAFSLERVMVAAYGLAEATVGVSMWPPSTVNGVDEDGTVSVGKPFPDVAVYVRDDEDEPVAAGERGHVLVSSPAVTTGYFDNDTATAELQAGPNTIRTGDVGYIDEEGDLYIVGRAKDVIIQAGTSVYAQEIEEVAGGVAGLGRVAAIGIDDGRVEGEQVTVIAEIHPDLADEAAHKAAVVEIVGRLYDRFGFRPARTLLASPKTIPLTPNGKLRRAELRERYLAGTLAERFVYPLRSTS